jgi:SAM-dependent MidA family methyltransferase
MPIDSKIRSIIEENGYIKIDDMMRQALSVNSGSYYKSVSDIGASADFITSPEISQLFGEIIAVWLIQQWQKLGSPTEFSLVELGPGQGKLMSDMLRTAKIWPKFFDSIKISLFDINPNFIEKQKQLLARFNKDINWITDLKKLPELPTIFLANEFFDALPIKQFVKVRDTWFESMLIVDPVDGQIKYDKIQIPGSLQEQFAIDYKQANDGAVIEESIESLEFVRQISKKIYECKGAALIIDYGYNISVQDRNEVQYNSTLQAIKNHQYQPIISTLGESDITAHVDFNALTSAASEQGISNFGFLSQRDFLLKYGIGARSTMLKTKLTQNERDIIDRQVLRLTSTGAMGELFKVLEITNC